MCTTRINLQYCVKFAKPFYFQLSASLASGSDLKSMLTRSESITSLTNVGPNGPALNSSLFNQYQSELIGLQEEFKAGRLTMEEIQQQFGRWKNKHDLSKAQKDHNLDVERLRCEWIKAQIESGTTGDSSVITPKRNSLKIGIVLTLARGICRKSMTLTNDN